jgi:chromosome segregation ATPase
MQVSANPGSLSSPGRVSSRAPAREAPVNVQTPLAPLAESMTEHLDEQRLDQLIAQKENELRSAVDYRVSIAQAAARAKDAQVAELKQRLERLTQDSLFNLNLLQERDAELARFEDTLLRARGALTERDRLLSDLKVQVTELQTTLRSEQMRAAEAEVQARAQLHALQQRLDEMLLRTDSESRLQQQQFDSEKRSLLHRISELERALVAQHTEFSTSMEKALRDRETTFRQEHEQLQQAIANVTQELQRAEAKATTATAALSSVNAQLADCQTQLRDTQQRADANAAAVLETRSRAETVHATLLLRDSEVRQLQQERRELSHVLAECRMRLTDAAERAQTDYEARISLQNQCAALSKQLEDERSQARTIVTTTQSAVQQQLELMRTDAQTERARLEQQHRTEVAEMKRQLTDLQQQLTEKDEQDRVARGEVTNYTSFMPSCTQLVVRVCLMFA